MKRSKSCITRYFILSVFLLCVIMATLKVKRIDTVENLDMTTMLQSTTTTITTTTTKLSIQSTDLMSIQHNFRNKHAANFPLITLFTTFTTKEEKYVCRNNTLHNWISLAPYVKPVFFSDDDNLINAARSQGWDAFSPPKSSVGIPVLKYMFIEVMRRYDSPFYGYANGDILFTNSLIDTLNFISLSKVNQSHPMLIVGKRTNVKGVTTDEAKTSESITNTSKRGALTLWGIDYFITSSNYPWQDEPEVVVGRAIYDDWLVLNARIHRFSTIDATKTLLAVHQTTKSGDAEHTKHKFKDYNVNLLRRLYNSSPNFKAGYCDCTTYRSHYSSDHQLILLEEKKILLSPCFPLLRNVKRS